MSRAYYALYHASYPLADNLPRSDREKRTDNYVGHESIRERLWDWHAGEEHRELKTRARALSQAFEKCRKLRVVADYELNTAVSVSEAKQQVTIVQNAMTTAFQLRQALGIALPA